MTETTTTTTSPLAELPFASEVERDLAQRLVEVEASIKASRVRARGYSRASKALYQAADDYYEQAQDDAANEKLAVAQDVLDIAGNIEEARVSSARTERKKIRAALRAYGWDPDAILKA